MAQVPGGIGLHVTKAAIGADLAVLRNVKDFTAAYLYINSLLSSVGYQDAGHKGCGASTLVEASTADELAADQLLSVLPAMMVVDDTTAALLRMNQASKQRRLESGFFGGWDNGWHEGFLADTVPHNFAILADVPADHETHGHHESGALVVGTGQYGFAKNRFIRETGRQAFAVTTSPADKLTRDIITKIGGSQEEKARLRLELSVDTPQVLNQLVAKDFPIFTDAA